ncbi:hypothetical protein [Edwardsiella phage MSW-3]|uniref:Uncharacterized protein n=1 Tax=Edwardsiella phage MSW-3 TaxID=1264700 RepID=L0MZ36_9CAUD|nr:hypothetical protein G428_gp49 [Edwardsiella phage MSW-3]BAM68870.1 hypothetical protein [Edwardsiella phage MSW-3]
MTRAKSREKLTVGVRNNKVRNSTDGMVHSFIFPFTANQNLMSAGGTRCE